MQKSKIEWLSGGYTINPVKGLCPMACPYCYAKRMYKRFKWNPEIRYNPNVMLDTGNITKPSKIFVGSTMELFGEWIKPEWMQSIMDWVKTDIGVHTYIFLTKQPQNLTKFSPFPDNAWIGVSATDVRQFHAAVHGLAFIKAKVRFISFEPLLSPLAIESWALAGLLKTTCNWLIIGAQTPYSAKTAPKIEWVKEIVEAADKAEIPVFLKENLLPVFWVNGVKDHVYFPAWATVRGGYRQEFPKEV